MKEKIWEFVGKYACLIGFCLGIIIGFFIYISL